MLFAEVFHLYKHKFEIRPLTPLIPVYVFILCRSGRSVRSGRAGDAESGEGKNCTCGIVNSDEVTTLLAHQSGNKYPWFVAIRKRLGSGEYTHYTGTLVSDLFVVTAASVFDNPQNSEQSITNTELFEAKPGATLWENTEGLIEIMNWQPIAELWIHPYYNSLRSVVPSEDLSYNVALLKLERRVDFYQEGYYLLGVRPICLPTPGHTKMEALPEKYNVLNGRNLATINAKILDKQTCQNQIPQISRYKDRR